MARRPFFSGNYGSALGSYDTAARLLAGAGQAQGQMFANLGADIGGAIEKYGLMKEKQKKDKGFLKGALAGIKALRESDPNPETNILYDSIIAQAEDENIPLSQRVAMVKQGQQQINITGQQQLRNSLLESRDTQREATEQMINMRDRLEAEEKEKREIRLALNESLKSELGEYRETLAGLEPSMREGFEPTPRTKWLQQLAPLIDRGAVPARDAIFDPTKARITELGLSELERRHRVGEAGEKVFPPEDRAAMEKREKEVDIGYKEGMLSIAMLSALKDKNPSVGKKAEDVQGEITKLLAGPIGHNDSNLKGIKLSDYLSHEDRDDDLLDERSKKLLVRLETLKDEHSLILDSEQVEVLRTNKATGGKELIKMPLRDLMKIQEEQRLEELAAEREAAAQRRKSFAEGMHKTSADYRPELAPFGGY